MLPSSVLKIFWPKLKYHVAPSQILATFPLQSATIVDVLLVFILETLSPTSYVQNFTVEVIIIQKPAGLRSEHVVVFFSV